MKLDSDGGGHFSGRVNSLVRGVLGGFSSDKNNLVTLTMNCSDTLRFVDLPIQTQSDFEFGLYQQLYLMQWVDYSKIIGIHDGIEWTLKFNSGPLKGQVQSYSRD